MLQNFYNKIKLRTIDFYIIKKFIGTFAFSLTIIVLISVVFDYAEKVDDFMENKAPISEIIFDYYLNFIPYFANLFSYIFTFITVILFTSRMASGSEVIAILSTGISYRRMLYPYFISATIIAIFSFLLSAFVIPYANKDRLAFEYKYILNNPYGNYEKNIHRQIRPGIFVYASSYDGKSQIAQRFSIEKFENGKLISKLNSNYAQWDSTSQKWHVFNYYNREIKGMTEVITKGLQIDTSAFILPTDFSRGRKVRETMNINELDSYIKEERARGSSAIEQFEIEKYKRFASPFATYILMLIGVSLSSRKVRGGTGLHVGIGIFLSFSYILFFEIFSQAAIGGVIPSIIAVWIPNLIYVLIAFILYKLAPK